MNNPLLGSLPGSTGSGQPGTVSPGQVLSMGEDLYKAATLSDEDVKKIADESIAEMDSRNPVASPSNPYAKRLAKLTKDLHNAEGLNLDFKVYLARDVNAVSLPNGSVRVFSALMDRLNDDELKFVLGHEIAHIKNGHRKARLQRAYASSAAVKAANTAVKASTSSSVGGYAAVLGADMAAELAAEVINAQFSQGDETECDEYGLHLLASKNLPKDAAVNALLKLGGDSDTKKTSNDFFASLTSSHPDPVARAQHLQEMIPELAGQPLPLQVATSEQPTRSDDGSTRVASAKLPEEELPGEELGGDTRNVASAQSPRKVAQTRSESRGKTKDALIRGSGWYVQVGAFSNQDSARALQNSLSPGAKSAALHKGIQSGHAIYRVVVGPFNSRAHAQQELDQVLSGRSAVSDAFVRKL